MSALICVVLHEELCWCVSPHAIARVVNVACYIIYHVHEALVLEICLIDLRLSLLRTKAN